MSKVFSLTHFRRLSTPFRQQQQRRRSSWLGYEIWIFFLSSSSSSTYFKRNVILLMVTPTRCADGVTKIQDLKQKSSNPCSRYSSYLVSTFFVCAMTNFRHDHNLHFNSGELSKHTPWDDDSSSEFSMFDRRTRESSHPFSNSNNTSFDMKVMLFDLCLHSSSENALF